VLVLFDLDQTLVDSRPVAPFREIRRWSEAYRLIHLVKPYDGIPELLQEICLAGHASAIVTSAPRSYCQQVLVQQGWQDLIATSVCYHCTRLHKPQPQPVQEALSRLKISPDAAVMIGDENIDVLAARAAGTMSVGALWGALDPAGLAAARPDFLVDTVQDLRRLFQTILKEHSS